MADLARILAGLNREQAAAVTDGADVVRIIAGAGSGKTRVLTRRIARRAADDSLDPKRTLAVTFTRRAASELRSRLGQLGLRHPVNAGTFHSIAYAQLRQRWAERGIAEPALLERKVGFVARFLRSASSTAPLDVVAEIEWAKARRITPDNYAEEAVRAQRDPPFDPEIVASIFDRYEREKLERRLVDFDDLIRLATRDLHADSAYADACRWRHRHLFVDEFQDVNPLQFELLRAWVGDSPDLCVVGDPNQAIYAWNGADPGYLTGIERWWPSAATVALTENYRSSPQILACANSVLATAPAAAFLLHPNRPDGPVPQIVECADETTEAQLVARRIRDAHAPGRPWSDQAVLVRTNSQLGPISEALTGAQVPHRLRGTKRLTELPEIRDAFTRLRTAGPLREAIVDLETTLGVQIASDDSVPLTEPHTSAEPSPGLLGDDRARNVAELIRLGHEFLELDPHGELPAFRSWLTSTLRNDDGMARGDAVELMTFHAAKGLEWPIVHLCGLEDGFVPIHHASSDDDEAEERRLLYVAMTRAEDHLVCSWAAQRAFGSRTFNRRPSPWIDTIATAIAVARGDEAPSRRRDRAGRAGTRDRPGSARGGSRRPPGAALSAEDNALFERLREWRREQARLADVPAFVIFNDATLAEVARRRPSTHDELLGVPGIGAVKAQRFGPALLERVSG